MKKLLLTCITSLMAISLVACSSNTSNPEATVTPTPEVTEATTVIVSVTNEEGNPIDVEFPLDPQRVVCLNWQTVDFLDNMGLGDRIVGIIKDGSYPEHLKSYVENEEIVNVGGMKKVDMEAVMSLQPDVIFSSDRTESKYQEFSKIAPTMSSFVDYKAGFMNGFKQLAVKHGQIFNVSDEVSKVVDSYDSRIAEIAKFAEGKTALLGIFAGGLNTLGNTGRASIIVNEMGFENLAGEENVNHGNVSSYEAWLKLNPDWMFILDKDTAVGTEAVAAVEQMETNNAIIAQTNAFKNGNIVYLEPGTTWYIADGGLTSLDLMISCIEEGIKE